jgi:flagellar motor switch protein FliN/FliY
MQDDEAEARLSQEDIDAALAQAGQSRGSGAPEPPAGAPGGDPRADSPGRPFDEVAAAMAEAIESEAGSQGPPGPSPEAPAGSARFDVPELPSAGHASADGIQGIDLLRDVDLDVKIELGRSRMLVDDVLRLGEGSVVELDKLAGDPVDVFVNNRLVARGEVLVLNDNFCVRINDIVTRDLGEEVQD